MPCAHGTQLMPCAHGTQLDTIHKLQHIITSVLTYPTTQPTQHSACAAVLERLGNTSATDATELNTRSSSSTTPQLLW
jgi:hypothetical protein